MKNEQGDMVNLPKVKPATAVTGYTDHLLQAETMKKDDVELLAKIISSRIDEYEE